ncbi:MAG: hypothetical protein AAF587_10615 [Bacteroidota bacterium]
MLASAQDYLMSKLTSDQLEECLDLLLADDANMPEEIREELILLSARLNRLAEKERQDLLDPKDIDRSRNQIRSALLELVDELPEDLRLSPKRLKQARKNKIKGIVAIGVYLIVAGALLFLAFQAKTHVRVEADLLLDCISFQHKAGDYDFHHSDLQGLSLYNYGQLEMEADGVAVDEFWDESWGERYSELEQNILLTQDPDIGGVGIPIVSPVRIEELPIESGARVSLYRPTDEMEKQLIRLIIDQEDELLGRLSYRDSLDIHPEQVTVEGLGEREFLYSPMVVRLFGSSDERKELSFLHQHSLLTLDLSIADSLVLQGLGLQIASPEFFRRDEDRSIHQAIPTVLGGFLQIKEVNQAPLLHIPFQQERTALHLRGAASLDVQQLSIGPEGIHIQFAGYVDRIETGGMSELRNPSYVSWMWHNQRSLLIGIGILLFGMIFFLPTPLRKQVLFVLRTIHSLR